MASTSRPQRKELVEFHTIKLWAEDSKRKLQELYKELVPSFEEFHQMALKQLEEALKPRPIVRPCIRQRKRPSNDVPAVQQCAAPDTSSVVTGVSNTESTSSVVPEASHLTSTPQSSPDVNVASESLTIEVAPKERFNHPRTPCPTARKSTTGRVVKRNQKKLLRKCLRSPCSIPLINLKVSDLSGFVVSQLRQYEKEGSKREAEMKLFRKPSTDSGVSLSEDEIGAVPPIKIHLSRNEQEISGENPSTNTTTVIKSTSNQAKKRRIDSAHSKTGGADRKICRPSKVANNLMKSSTEGNVEPTKKPSIKVSIPWDEALRSRISNSSHGGYLRNLNPDDDNSTEKTALPNDVVPAVEFDLESIQMSPLACKRYKEAAPLQYFLPYAGQAYVCVSCNISFPGEQDLAKHMLANHRSSYNF